MHDIKTIRDNPDRLISGLARRYHAEGAAARAKAEAEVAALLTLDDARRAAIVAAQEVQEKRNALSKQIGQAMAAKDVARADALKAEVAALKDAGPELDNAQKKAEQALRDALAAVPNIPRDDVPDGADEHDNVEYGARRGTKREHAFAPKQHFEIGEALGLMDFEAAAALSGSRFVVLKGGLARLERALGQFMLDLHTTEHGYQEVNPPLLVRDEAMFGTAQLPKFRDDQFATSSLDGEQIYVEFIDALNFMKHTIQTDRNANIRDMLDELQSTFSKKFYSDEYKKKYWLIPTAEVPLTNLVREQILAPDVLPLRYTALTPCFRAEAGAAGRDTRGMLRQHQFMKCELVSIAAPEASSDEHERMLACAEAVLKKLDLHYRVVTLCTGDMGFASQKTYDIEVWLPGQGAYREVSSCSTCGDFQARRMEARMRGPDGKPVYVHTLNGSGVAVGRALIAVLETYQNEDGSVTVPPALQPYMGGMTRIERAA